MTRISTKTVVLAVPLAIAAAAACSSTPAETFGGSGGSSSGGMTSTAAGTTATAAGTTATAAGSTSTEAGTSSSAAGTSSVAGSTGTSGSSAGGSDGGGTSGGGTSAGGMAGSGGGSGPCETIDCLLGTANANQDKLTNAFIIFGCYDKASQDCITLPTNMQCPDQDPNLPFEQQGLHMTQSFPIGGVPGKHYWLTISVNGVTEAKYYENGTCDGTNSAATCNAGRAAGNMKLANAFDPNGLDTFYMGGDPVNVENYNIYKFTSKDGSGTEVKHYYLNSFPPPAQAAGEEYEHHETFPISYTHQVEVVGGGTVELLQADRNCHAIDNCGAGFRTTSCANTDGIKVPNDPNLVIPMNYMGKPVSGLNLFGGTTQPFHSQILHIVVKSVAPKQ